MTERVVVVCDAGPIIHLHEVECLELIEDFSRVLVPRSVWDEVNRIRPRALELSCLARVSAAHPQSHRLDVLSTALSLHAGELEAIAVALENPSSVLLTDDTAARIAAGNLAIRVHGTVGILVRAIRRGLRSRERILEILRTLPVTSSLHINRSLLDSVIKQVEEFPLQ